MRSIIIEDQAPAQRILQKYIDDSNLLRLEKTFSNALEAKAYLENHAVDLIFLDVDLPSFSGMDFLRSEQNHPITILTTAYSEYALESYEFNVIDYLLKPFSFERFSQAIDKVNAMTWSLRQISNVGTLPTDNHIYIKSSHDLVKLDKKEVIFIKSDSDYTEVVTSSKSYLTSESLRDWMTKLDNDFQQVHKSYIVNAGHFQKISHNKIHLITGQVIPVGRAFKKEFMKNLLLTRS